MILVSFWLYVDEISDFVQNELSVILTFDEILVLEVKRTTVV
jgi:hypothetical protein